MSKNNSYKPGPNDFLDYSEGKLKGRKRNAFERYLEQNLFDAEAMEGFDLVSRDEAEQDLAAAGKQINRRINRRKRIGWYSAAAAVVSILAISTIFFNVDRSSVDKQELVPELPKGMEKSTEKKAANEDLNLLEGDEMKDAGEVKETPAQIKEVLENNSGVNRQTTEAVVGVDETGGVEDATDQVVIDEVATGKAAAPEKVEEEIVLDDVVFEAEEDEAENLDFMVIEDSEMEEAAPMEAPQADASKGKVNVEGAVEEVKVLEETVQAAPISAEKSMRVSSAPKRSEPAGAVSVEQAGKTEQTATVIQSAKPLEGMTAYMEYVNSELVFPSTELSRTSAIVEIKFYILPSGRPYNIQIVSSPAQVFSDEVHRVITNGPDWVPANRGGEYVDEEVSMKIEFGEKLIR